VVVQVCLKLMGMISASNLAGPLPDAAVTGTPTEVAAIPAVLRRSLRFTCLDPSGWYHGPMLVVQVADPHYGMFVRRGIDGAEG
jgi:hypothetical protein